MKYHMTDQQAKKLAEFLNEMRSLRELESKHRYSWIAMAKDIHIGKELLLKLKDGKHKGINEKTVKALGLAFGNEALLLIGIPVGAEPTFKVTRR
jgi:predicted transcriptional regulator